jgi:hypothetical protein
MELKLGEVTIKKTILDPLREKAGRIRTAVFKLKTKRFYK